MVQQLGRRPRVGLALGGGGAWGFAHVALIARLERDKIPIDLITGCSMGAAIGGLYAAGGMAALETFVARRRRLLPTLLASVTGPRPLGRFLERIIGDVRLEDAQIPFHPVCADLVTGEEVVPSGVSVAEGITLSSRLAPFWPARRAGGRVLVDGAIANMVPVDAARAAGADVVISCNVIPRTFTGRGRLREGFASLCLLMHRFGETQSAAADQAFRLGDASVLMTDFHKAPQIIARARARLPTAPLRFGFASTSGRQRPLEGHLPASNADVFRRNPGHWLGPEWTHDRDRLSG